MGAGALVRFWIAGALVACNVEPSAHDECHAELEAQAGCPAAALVVMSDFVSTQVALATPDGKTLCGSYFSTARAETTSTGFALSGDVVVPSTRPPSGRAVLIDRYGTNVVSFLVPSTGTILGQLAVGTGFESNPQDYLELDDRHALVSRWGQNPVPGQEPFDAGSDLLVIDTRALRIDARIALPAQEGFPPRPSGLVRVGTEAVVTLQRASTDVRSMGDGMLAGIDLDALAVAWTLTLRGLKNCGPVALAPDGAVGAVACTGFIDRTGAGSDIDQSAVVVLDVTTSPPSELRRLAAKDIAGGLLQNGLEFFAARRVLAKTQTALDGSANNRLLAIDLDVEDASHAAEVLLEARPNPTGAGQGVVFGGALCTPGCGDTCLLADADRRVLERWSIEGDVLVPLGAVSVTGTVGLPPRDLGGL
jgi:hypothetical protein